MVDFKFEIRKSCHQRLVFTGKIIKKTHRTKDVVIGVVLGPLSEIRKVTTSLFTC
jgi:hypothetical protein